MTGFDDARRARGPSGPSGPERSDESGRADSRCELTEIPCRRVFEATRRPRSRYLASFVLLGIAASLTTFTSCASSKTAQPSTHLGPNATGVGSAFGASSAASAPTPRLAVVRYLDALVARDWKLAVAFECVDLGERETPSALKRASAAAANQHGALKSFTIDKVDQGVGDANTAASVMFSMRYARQTLRSTANLESEGPQWRICSLATR